MRILVPIDGSPHSEAAISEVVSRPWPAGSEVRVLVAIQPYPPMPTEVGSRVPSATMSKSG